ncbi:MAG TPA: ABC transporter ATP-binding protein, partial [Planctomycetaceae bacterium]|nr:ABC transporter ATP-binding protein [Planctomycetaceae bacterium]
MLTLEAVRKVYRKKQDEVVALDSTSLEIARGDFIAIIGPSGSGKTTLLSMLGAMSAPSEGRILLDGESIYDLPVNLRAEVRQNK